MKMEVVWVYSYEMSVDPQCYMAYHCDSLNWVNYVCIADREMLKKIVLLVAIVFFISIAGES
jgi:hypothetical protein